MQVIQMCRWVRKPLPSVAMSHSLIFRKRFWVTNWLRNSHCFASFEVWNLFPAIVGFQNVCGWHSHVSVVIRAEGQYSYLPTAPSFLVLWLPNLYSLRKVITVRELRRAPPATYISSAESWCLNSRCLWASVPLNTSSRPWENSHG